VRNLSSTLNEDRPQYDESAISTAFSSDAAAALPHNAYYHPDNGSPMSNYVPSPTNYIEMASLPSGEQRSALGSPMSFGPTRVNTAIPYYKQDDQKELDNNAKEAYVASFVDGQWVLMPSKAMWSKMHPNCHTPMSAHGIRSKPMTGLSNVPYSGIAAPSPAAKKVRDSRGGAFSVAKATMNLKRPLTDAEIKAAYTAKKHEEYLKQASANAAQQLVREPRFRGHRE
jgi:hypothetical protein